MNPTQVRLVLVAPQQELCDHWSSEFSDVPDTSIVCGRFEDLVEYDCMVSPGNSFGLMDGGIDLAITRYFGYELMDRVQAAVVREYRGEQPVGTSMIVETGSTEHPFLAHTPTMRVPMTVSRTDNAYLAMLAMLVAVWRHNEAHDQRIGTVACPGLGTGCGQMELREAARQMALATRHFHSPPDAISWPFAAARQRSIRRGGDQPLHGK